MLASFGSAALIVHTEVGVPVLLEQEFSLL